MSLFFLIISLLLVTFRSLYSGFKCLCINRTLSNDISELVSNDTLNYIISYNPYILDEFNGMNDYSQMRSLYYDINDFEEVNNDEFDRIIDEQGEYKYFTLDNKIKVFLVSKPILYKSTIALSVRYGTLHEPKNVQGLSFLLKNLIISKVKLRRSKRVYPLFFKNLQNSITGKVGKYYTNYFIETFNKDIGEALYKLSSVLSNEMDIDDNSLNLVIKATKEELIKENELMDNLYSIISTHLSSNKKERRSSNNPKINLKEDFGESNQYLVSVIKDQFEKYYNGNLMVLTIISTKDMNELTKLAKIFFGKIRSSKMDMKDLYETLRIDPNPYLKYTGKIITIQQNTINYELRLIFPIPYQKNLWRYKLTEYLSYYLDDESDESLAGILKSKGWIESLSSECETSDNGYSNFVILVNLKKNGIRHVLQIIESVFSTIKLISKIDFSDETLKLVREDTISDLMGFYFELDVDKADYILKSYLSTSCSPKDVLTTPYKMESADKYQIYKFFNFIRPENMIITYPVRSLNNGASYYVRESKSYYDSFLKKIESFVFRIYYGLMRITLKWMGINIKYKSKNPSKKFSYSIDLIPTYIMRRLSSISDKIALEELKVQLYEPTLENSNVLFIDESYPSNSYPLSLGDSIKKYNLDSKCDLSEYKINFKLKGIHNLKRFSVNQYDLESLFYMPLKNKMPTVSLNFEIKLPTITSNSTDVLLLNINRSKLPLISYLFKHSISLSLINTPAEERIKLENYTEFLNNNVVPGLTITWEGNTQYFEEFFHSITHTLSNFRNILTLSHFMESKNSLNKLINQLNDPNNEDYCLNLLLQIIHFDSIKPWTLENDVKYITFEDVKNFGRLLLKYGEFQGIVIGNCTPAHVYSYLENFLKLIRPNNRLFNSMELMNNKIIKIMSNLYEENWSSSNFTKEDCLNHFPEKSLLRNTERSKIETRKNLINVELLPIENHKTYYFKHRVSNLDPFSCLYLFIYLGGINEKNICLLDFLKLIDFYKVINSFIATKKELKFSSINFGPLDISNEAITFHVRITFITSKMIPMIEMLLEFYNSYFINAEKVFTENDFLSMKNMLLSNFYSESLDSNKLIRVHFERIVHSNFVPDWRQKEIDFIESLDYNKFIDIWSRFKTAPTLLIAVQSNRTNRDETQNLKSFTPDGYTRLYSIYQFKDFFRLL